MVNTFWALLIPGAMSVYNMIITRTFFQNGVPHELLEASQIDGCSDARYFFSILLPLSGAATGTLTEAESVWPMASVTITFTVQLP